MAAYKVELRNDEGVWKTLEREVDDVRILEFDATRLIGDLIAQPENAQRIVDDQACRFDVSDSSGLLLFVMHLQLTESPAIGRRR